MERKRSSRIKRNAETPRQRSRRISRESMSPVAKKKKGTRKRTMSVGSKSSPTFKGIRSSPRKGQVKIPVVKIESVNMDSDYEMDMSFPSNKMETSQKDVSNTEKEVYTNITTFQLMSQSNQRSKDQEDSYQMRKRKKPDLYVDIDQDDYVGRDDKAEIDDEDDDVIDEINEQMSKLSTPTSSLSNDNNDDDSLFTIGKSSNKRKYQIRTRSQSVAISRQQESESSNVASRTRSKSPKRQRSVSTATPRKFSKSWGEMCEEEDERNKQKEIERRKLLQTQNVWKKGLSIKKIKDANRREKEEKERKEKEEKERMIAKQKEYIENEKLRRNIVHHKLSLSSFRKDDDQDDDQDDDIEMSQESYQSDEFYN